MIAKALEKLHEMTRKEPTLTIDGRTYALKGYEPVYNPTIDAMRTHTLEGILNMIVDLIDGPAVIEPEDFMDLRIHIVDPTVVVLKSREKGPFLLADNYVAANAYVTNFPFGKPLDVETFIIALNSQFMKTPDRDSLLQLVSAITKDTSGTISDTGVSQKMDIKNGISFKDRVEVKNPFVLQPYRTFIEIEQPASEFVFRVHDGRDGIQCSLHEADGSLWKLEAVRAIRSFFKEHAPQVTVIL